MPSAHALKTLPRPLRAADLPPAPAGRTGWPWTDEEAGAGGRPTEGAALSFSIVTPSFNQGRFLEATVRSVLLQGHAPLQYIVVDGGSSDDSVEVLHKYSDFLSFESQPDRGQSHAINKGLARAEGDVIAWINSDDHYLPGALQAAAALFAAEPGTSWVAGDCRWRWAPPSDGAASTRPDELRASRVEADEVEWLVSSQIQQASSFWRRELQLRAGPLDESMSFAMDGDLFVRFLSLGARPRHIDRALSVALQHEANKTTTSLPAFVRERLQRVLPRQLAAMPEETRRRARRRIGLWLADVALHEVAHGRPGAALAFAARACGWHAPSALRGFAAGARHFLARRLGGR